MRKFLLMVVAGIISSAVSFAANADETNGFYAGGDIGAALSTFNSAGAGAVTDLSLAYGGILGYRFNDYFSVEGDYKKFNSKSNLNSGTGTQTADSSGTTAAVLYFPTGKSLFLKAGVGNVQTSISGSKTTLVSTLFSSSFVTSSWSENHDSSTVVLGIGGELPRAGKGLAIRTGLDYYSLTSMKGGSEGVLDLYLAALYRF